eukprot:gene10993-7637_t
MVLVECKRLPKEEYSKDYDVFLASFTLATNIGEAADALQKMQNTRVRLRWIIAAAKQLAKDNVQDPDQKHHLLGPVEEAERYLALERAQARQTCEQEELDKLIATFKGGATILFPAECSGSDAVQRLTEVAEGDEASDAEKSKAHRIVSILDDGATTDATLTGPVVMWWSARALDRSSDFAKYLGKNEKTKITVKLAPQGAAAPPREPAVDTKTQQELMAHYYRKQEEMKKVIEDDDISFGNSEWANPRGLKNQLLGMDDVNKPGQDGRTDHVCTHTHEMGVYECTVRGCLCGWIRKSATLRESCMEEEGMKPNMSISFAIIIIISIIIIIILLEKETNKQTNKK